MASRSKRSAPAKTSNADQSGSAADVLPGAASDRDSATGLHAATRLERRADGPKRPDAGQEVAATLALIDGLSKRGLLRRARVITVGACSLQLDPHTEPEELERLRRSREEFERERDEDDTYAAS